MCTRAKLFKASLVLTSKALLGMFGVLMASVTINCAAQTLLVDTFGDGDYDGWTVVDEGIYNAPSYWRVISGTLWQQSVIWGGDINNQHALPQPGTYALYDNGSAWSDYQLDATLSSATSDTIGLMFRVKDANNYYRLSWNRMQGYLRLVKKQAGSYYLLDEKLGFRYTQRQKYRIQIRAHGSQLKVTIDGIMRLSATDGDIASGSVALYAWRNPGSAFHDVQVTSLVNKPPKIDAVSATPQSLLDTKTSRLAVSASDTDGPAALSYKWTILSGGGSLDNDVAKSPRYTPDDVTATTSVTLQIEVFDGKDRVSDTIQLTVLDANEPPVIDAISATPSQLSDNRTGQLAVVAHDPDNGPGALGYQWTILSGGGQLSSHSVANPLFTPPDVTTLTTVTLQVEVSDGAKSVLTTIDLTVTDAPISMQRGSVLVFPWFDVQPNESATQIRISNDSLDEIVVRLTAICGKRKELSDPQQVTCAAQSRTARLAGHATWVGDVKAYLQPSCNAGFIVAYAIDPQTDQAISRNQLSGSYHIHKLQPERRSAAQAVGIRSPVDSGNPTDVDGDGHLDFDGIEYNQLGAVMSTDFRGTSYNPLRASELTLLTMDIFPGAANFPTRVAIDFWNELKESFATSHAFFCWDTIRLDRLSRQFRVVNLGSTYGSLEITPVSSDINDDPVPTKAVVGVVREVGKGFHLIRNLYHSDTHASASFLR